MISALNQINLDEHNRIPSSDGRLLRRIVRDAMTRGNDARETISRWDSVRKGEEDNIFPYQEEADVMFNSAQIYEIAVLNNMRNLCYLRFQEIVLNIRKQKDY